MKEYRALNGTDDRFEIIEDGIMKSIQRSPWGYEFMSMSEPGQEWIEQNTTILPDDHEFVRLHKADESN